MRFIYTLVTNAIALFVVSLLLKGFVFEGGWIAPVVVAAVITVLNSVVKPFLKLLSFPLVFMTGGLFLIVINAVILYLSDYLVAVMDIQGVDLRVDNALTYVWAAVIFGLANWFLNWFFKE